MGQSDCLLCLGETGGLLPKDVGETCSGVITDVAHRDTERPQMRSGWWQGAVQGTAWQLNCQC
jgi:hypothetical protein